MVTSRADNTNPARIPALGVRALVFMALSIVLMVLDHRQNHLDTVRKALADELLFGRLVGGGKVTVDLENGEVVLTFTGEPPAKSGKGEEREEVAQA